MIISPLTQNTDNNVSPRTSRGAERRALLIDVATELFLKFGYDNVSLDQIVEHAGGSKATIYKYFGSKQGLFVAIYQDRCSNFIYQIKIAVYQDDVDIQQRLSNLLYDLYLIVAEPKNSGLWRLIIQISPNNPELALELYNLGPTQAHKIFADFLKEAHERKELHCSDPEQSAIYFFGFLHDLHWRSLVGLEIKESAEQMKKTVTYMVERFLTGHRQL